MNPIPVLAIAAVAAASPLPASPGPTEAPVPRVYAAEQFSNTVSVTDPATHRLLGLIRLGEQTPANLSPLYRGQLLVHGLAAAPDGRSLAVVSVGSNGVSFIDTATNTVKHTTYVGRSPHEAAFTPDGREVWVTVRGEDYVSILSPVTFQEIGRVRTPPGPGMAVFSPDGRYAYVCSSFSPKTVVVETATRAIVGEVEQPSPFCPNIAVAPDGSQVWFTLKDVGKVVAFNARPPFNVLGVLSTGPITNHVNFAPTPHGQMAYVTVGGLNVVKVFRTDTREQVATIPVGALPHGLWPAPDGARVYVGLENANQIAVIDTTRHEIVASVHVGQAPQALAYVPNAPAAAAAQNLQGLPTAASTLLTFRKPDGGASTSTVSLFDQGLVQVLQGAIEGLEPRSPYVLALAERADGSGRLEPLAAFTTNPAGGAVVNAIGPIRRHVQSDDSRRRRYLIVAAGAPSRLGAPVLLQAP